MKIVVAKVNGKEISKSEFDRLLSVYCQQNKKKIEDISQKERQNLLDRMVQNYLLEAEGIKRALTVPPELVEKEVSTYYNRFNGEKGFTELLKKEGVTLEKFKSDLAKNLLIHITINDEIGKKAVVTDQEAQKYFQDNEQHMKTPVKVQASHILFSSQKDDKKALNKAKDVLKLAKANNDFAKLAKDHSECPSSQKGGDLGNFVKGQMVPEFEKAAFEMKVGEISDLVKTQFGYHIIKKISQTSQQKLDYKSVENHIKNDLKLQQGEKIIASLTKKLQKESKVEYFPDLF